MVRDGARESKPSLSFYIRINTKNTSIDTTASRTNNEHHDDVNQLYFVTIYVCKSAILALSFRKSDF